MGDGQRLSEAITRAFAPPPRVETWPSGGFLLQRCGPLWAVVCLECLRGSYDLSEEAVEALRRRHRC